MHSTTEMVSTTIRIPGEFPKGQKALAASKTGLLAEGKGPRGLPKLGVEGTVCGWRALTQDERDYWSLAVFPVGAQRWTSAQKIVNA